MKYFILVVLLGFLAMSVASPVPPKKREITDQEMYNQMLHFIETHANIPEDKNLVENILASAKWAELVAQFGTPEIKKKMASTKTTKAVHK